MVARGRALIHRSKLSAGITLDLPIRTSASSPELIARRMVEVDTSAATAAVAIRNSRRGYTGEASGCATAADGVGLLIFGFRDEDTRKACIPRGAGSSCRVVGRRRLDGCRSPGPEGRRWMGSYSYRSPGSVTVDWNELNYGAFLLTEVLHAPLCCTFGCQPQAGSSKHVQDTADLIEHDRKSCGALCYVLVECRGASTSTRDAGTSPTSLMLITLASSGSAMAA